MYETLLHNPEMHFRLIIAAFAFCLSVYFFYRDFSKWKNSKIISAQIIGYKYTKPKWYKKVIGSPFTPIVRYKRNGKIIETDIKNLRILVPPGQFIKLRLSDKQDEHIRMHFLLILTSLIISIAAFVLITNITSESYFIIFLRTLLTTMFLMHALVMFDDYKLIGNWQLSLNHIRYKKPENYKNMKDEYSKSIEEKETTNYKDAMAYYYHRNKNEKNPVLLLLNFLILIICHIIWLEVISANL